MHSFKNKKMTIKEYKKNFQLHYKEIIEEKEKEREREKNNFNKSQNIFLYKIIKNKKIGGKIPLDSTINKSIEEVFKNDEKRKNILNIIKNKNKPAKTSYEEKARESCESPTFYMGNSKKRSKIKKMIDFSSPNKSYISVNLNDRNPNNSKIGKIKEISDKSNISYKDYNTHNKTTRYKKKIITGYKSNTPLASFRHKKFISSNSQDGKNDKSQKKKLYGAIYKINRNHNYNKISKQNKTQNLSFNKKVPPFLKKKAITKTNIKKPIYLNTSVNSPKNELNEIKDKQDKNENNFKTINTNKSNEIDNNNINSSHDILSSQNNSYIEEKNIEINISNNLNNLKYSNISNYKEFNNVQIQRNNRFVIENIAKNKEFKNIKQQKCVRLMLKNQIKVIKEKEKERKNSVKDKYTGYILSKKFNGKIEKETKFENDLEKIKFIFLDLIKNVSKDQLELITINELSSLKSEINKNSNIIEDLNKEKNEYILKIKEKDAIIEKRELEFKEYQKEFLKLKNDFEVINSENEKLKEKIYILEQENMKMKEDNSKLNEEYTNYKNTNEAKRDNEIKDLEGKIKKFKEELKKKNNNIGNNTNLDGAKVKSKRMSVKYNFKFDQMLNNLEKKKITQNRKNSLKLSKIIPEEKKINEDEEKEEKGIEGDYEKNETEENKVTEENVRIMENYENDTLNKNSIIKDANKIEQPTIDNNVNDKNNNEEINNNNNIKEIEITKIQNNFIQKNSILIPIPENSDKYMRSKSNDNTIDRKEEKSKRISKAFNRFKKNISNNIIQDGRNNSSVKKSNKINEIAKMLEQKISADRSEDKIEVSYDNKAVTDDETDRELNMVELLKSKPINKKKAKPSIKNKF